MKHRASPKGKDLASNKNAQYAEEVDNMLEERVRNLDELAIHDELMGGVLQSVRDDIRNGASAEELLDKYASLAAARIVTIAATDADSSRALSAAKDLLDRSRGKAVERKQIHHKLDKVKDDQLDAILLTEIEALDADRQEADD